jgi:hypothetical protein
MARVDDIISRWGKQKASLRCSEVVDDLASLGFVVKDSKTPGHKTFSHPQLRDFFGAGFNCGHGRNPEIKSSYINNILRVLRQRQDELRDIEQSK